MTRVRKTWAAGGVALLVMAGCSGGNHKQAAPPTSAPAGGPTTSVRPVDTRFSGQGSGEFCTLARTYNDRFTKVGPSATKAELRALAREGQTAIAKAVDVAPPEIKADVQVISTAFGSVLAELEKVDFDASKITVATFAKLQAPEFATSTQRFQAYVTNVCKVAG